MLLALVGLLKVWLPHMLNMIADIFTYVNTISTEWNTRLVWEVMVTLSWMSLLLLGPLFLASIVVAILVNYLQVGNLLTMETITPKISRLSPIEGLKRMFGVKALVQLVKSLLKMGVIGYFLFDVIR